MRRSQQESWLGGDAWRMDARRHGRLRRRQGLAAILVGGLVAAACSTGAGGGTSKADAAHPMSADSLGTVMRGFDAAVRDEVPAQTDEFDRWEGVFPSIAEAAAELKASAVQLSGHPPDGLELPDRGRFQVLGRSLADAAGRLEEAANRADADAVERARAGVGKACRDCHSRFRPDSPGVPDAFR